MRVRLIVCLAVSTLVTVLAAVFLYLGAVPLQFWQQLLLLLMLFGLVFVVSYYGGLLARRLGRQIRNWWHRPNLRRQLTILWASIRRLYRPRSKYDLPLFLLLTDDLDREKPILGKMGLKPIERIDSDSPVQYWLGEESAFITLDRGSTFAYHNWHAIWAAPCAGFETVSHLTASSSILIVSCCWMIRMRRPMILPRRPGRY